MVPTSATSETRVIVALEIIERQDYIIAGQSVRIAPPPAPAWQTPKKPPKRECLITTRVGNLPPNVTRPRDRAAPPQLSPGTA